MVEYRNPGVFVDEQPFRGRTIVATPTSTAAFVGRADGLTEPTRLTSATGLPAPGAPRLRVLERAGRVDVLTDALLAPAVEAFFRHGGRACWVVPTGAPDAPPTAASIVAAIAALADLDEPTILVAPELVHLDTASWATSVAALLDHAAAARRFVVLDVPDAWSDVPGAVASFRAAVPASDGRGHAAAYAPYLEQPRTAGAHADATIAAHLVDGSPGPIAPGTSLTELVAAGAHAHVVDAVRARLAAGAVVPPSGSVAGRYAHTDETRGVWKAPANVSIAGAPTAAITDAQQDALNVSPEGLSVNAIRSFPGRGTLVWGARTLASHDAERRYVNVRRLVAQVESSLEQGLRWTVFEPNSEPTRAAVRATVTTFLTDLWRRGALQGARADDAFFVACGLGRTMSANDVRAGRLIAEVGLAVMKPAEFTIVRWRGTAAPS